VRWVVDAAIHHLRARRQAREAGHVLALCPEKLTDEGERRMMERITRNESFRPESDV
jgi:hypothetical protein